MLTYIVQEGQPDRAALAYASDLNESTEIGELSEDGEEDEKRVRDTRRCRRLEHSQRPLAKELINTRKPQTPKRLDEDLMVEDQRILSINTYAALPKSLRFAYLVFFRNDSTRYGRNGQGH